MGAVVVECRCVACKHVAEFGPEQRDVPMCPKCYAPMVAISAEGRVA